jgi:hypothetical protein
MKTKNLILTTLFLVISVSTVLSQGFTPPAEGKAVIYFTRVTRFAGSVSFEYFHQDKYIGIFKGSNYMRYECDPGQQLLWASSENKEFITSDLKAGETYIVIVNIEAGAWKARVGLQPISANDTVLFKRAKDLIIKKKPVVTSEAKIQEMNIKLATFIAEKLRMYETTWKKKYTIGHISTDMAIPFEYLK